MASFVPGGSYSLTSQNIASTLFCQAQKRDQSWIPASLDLTNLSSADVANMDGHLVNESGSASSNGYVPGGSYSQTCTGIRVILSAYCQKRDQSWQWSTLDITDLPASAEITNIDGVLTA